MFSALKEATDIPITFVNGTNNDFVRLINEAYAHYDFVIQTRMDIDDFVYKDAVIDTQTKVDECNGILWYGYCKGYMYSDKKLYVFPYLAQGLGHSSIFASLILESAFAEKIPFLGVYSFYHHRVKKYLRDFLKKNGIEFSENMFQQNTSNNAYIYFRQEFSNDIIARGITAIKQLKANGGYLVENPPTEQLAKDFGFHYELE